MTTGILIGLGFTIFNMGFFSGVLCWDHYFSSIAGPRKFFREFSYVEKFFIIIGYSVFMPPLLIVRPRECIKNIREFFNG